MSVIDQAMLSDSAARFFHHGRLGWALHPMYLKRLAGAEGLEPPTCGFGVPASTRFVLAPICITNSQSRSSARKKPHNILILLDYFPAPP